MRPIAVSLLVVLASFLAFADEPRLSADDTPPVKPPEAQKLEVKVEGKELSVAGTKVVLDGEKKALVDVLGKPSRTVEKANIIHVWDDLGVIAYEQPKTGKLIEVRVALADMNFEFWPKKLFRGKLTLDGASVTPATTIEAINKAKKGEPLVADELAKFNYGIRYEDRSVFIHKAKDGKFNENGTISTFGVSVERRKDR